MHRRTRLRRLGNAPAVSERQATITRGCKKRLLDEISELFFAAGSVKLPERRNAVPSLVQYWYSIALNILL